MSASYKAHGERGRCRKHSLECSCPSVLHVGWDRGFVGRCTAGGGMTCVSLGALVGTRLPRAAITTMWRVGAGGLDPSASVTTPVDHSLCAWLTIPHRDVARLSEPVGWGRGGRRLVRRTARLLPSPSPTSNKLGDAGGSVKLIKHILFTIVHKALGMRQLKFRRFLRVLGYSRRGYGITTRLVEGLSLKLYGKKKREKG